MSDNSRKHFYKILKDFDTAMLITHGVDNHLRARPMAIADIEENGRLWFATRLDSPKIDEIEMDERVNVSLQDSSKFLSISGTARWVRDRDKIDELWKEAWKLWFPQGKETPELALIEVSALEGEYWDNEGINKLKFIFEAAKAYTTGTQQRHDQDQHDKVAL